MPPPLLLLCLGLATSVAAVAAVAGGGAGGALAGIMGALLRLLTMLRLLLPPVEPADTRLSLLATASLKGLRSDSAIGAWGLLFRIGVVSVPLPPVIWGVIEGGTCCPRFHETLDLGVTGPVPGRDDMAVAMVPALAALMLLPPVICGGTAVASDVKLLSTLLRMLLAAVAKVASDGSE